MLEVTMLGTSCATPTVQRSLSSVAVRREGDIFLLDCGEGAQRQMMRFGLSYMRVKAVFITHLHLDHYLGLFGMIETMHLNGRQERLLVYGPPGLHALVFAFCARPFVDVAEIQKEGKIASFGELEVAAFRVKHGKESYGFALQEQPRRRFIEQKAKAAGIKGPMFSEIMEKGSIKVGGGNLKLSDYTYLQEGKKIVYSGDTAPCASLVRAAKDADLLIHEATFTQEMESEAKKASHSTALSAAQAARKAGAKALLLTHLSGRYRDASALLAEAKGEFENTRIAEDGMKIEV